jgi:hypothetical protein
VLLLLFSKDKFGKTAWHKAAEIGQVEILQKLWDWAKELQLKPEALRNELLLKSRFLEMSLPMASKPSVHKESTKWKAHTPPS